MFVSLILGTTAFGSLSEFKGLIICSKTVTGTPHGIFSSISILC